MQCFWFVFLPLCLLNDVKYQCSFFSQDRCFLPEDLDCIKPSAKLPRRLWRRKRVTARFIADLSAFPVLRITGRLVNSWSCWGSMAHMATTWQIYGVIGSWSLGGSKRARGLCVMSERTGHCEAQAPRVPSTQQSHPKGQKWPLLSWPLSGWHSELGWKWHLFPGTWVCLKRGQPQNLSSFSVSLLSMAIFEHPPCLRPSRDQPVPLQWPTGSMSFSEA